MRIYSQKGFTIIEMLMVILLVAILSAVAIPQFIDFRSEAKDASVKAAVGALRTGLANQKGQIAIRCGGAPGAWPSGASVVANDMTTVGGDCTAAQVPNATEREIVPTAMPMNPWGDTPSNTVAVCAGTGCSTPGQKCDGSGALDATTSGWCYNPANGRIWANSAQSTAADGPEYKF